METEMKETRLVTKADFDASSETYKPPAKNEDQEAQPTSSSDTKKDDGTHAQRLIEIGSQAKLFHDPEGVAWAQVEMGGHKEVYKLRSDSFKQWLKRIYYQKFAGIPSQQSTEGAMHVLEAEAQFNGDAETVYVRYAYANGSIYIDLCDADWRCVKVTPDGWAIQEVPDVMFRRVSKSLPLPAPTSGGSMEDLRPFLNSKIGDNEFTLIKAFLLGCLQPTGSFVHLDLEGEKGAGKSTTTKVLRMLIDPCVGLLLPLPRSEQDLIIAANSSRVLSYDNLSGLSRDMSDAFCRMSTGGGFQTRKFYTNDDEVIIETKKPVIFNGIDSIATKPDLLDRCIVINLQSISDEERKDETAFWEEFERARPSILGALLDAAAAALKNRATVTLESKPRMADFAMWVCAATEKAGLNKEAFLETYGKNRLDAIEIALEADALAEAVTNYIDKNETLSGRPTTVMKLLNSFVPEKPSGWPTERSIRKRLLSLKSGLRSKGIYIDISNRAENGYTISVSKEPPKTSSLSSLSSGNPKSQAQPPSRDDDVHDDVAVHDDDYRHSVDKVLGARG